MGRYFSYEGSTLDARKVSAKVIRFPSVKVFSW